MKRLANARPSAWKRRPPRVGWLLLASALLLCLTPIESSARGGRGGGGRMGGFSRGGVARSGSISRPPRPSPRPPDRAPDRARTDSRGSTRPSSPDRNIWGDIGNRPSEGGRGASEGSGTASPSTRPGDSRSRSGSFETRRGETVDWETEVSRGEDGLERNTSWESTSGASGSGSSSAKIENGQVKVDRTRHAESASGETIDRSWTASREGDWIVREGDVRTSTGVDAETASAVRRTDDGFVYHGAGSGRNGDYAGTIVKRGDDVYGRGVKVQGDDVTWGRIHCKGDRCTGGRVTADLDDYYGYPYYYYPYYYGWYSCPPGHVDVWHGAYGTPVYGCSDVVVVSTTLSLGPSASATSASAYDDRSARSEQSGRTSTNGSTETTGTKARRDASSAFAAAPSEARVTSQPVLMYELAPDLVVYASDEKPSGLHSVRHGKRQFWAPGPVSASKRTDDWLRRASEMKAPTANATVITYAIGNQLVYLTNEKPSPGYHAEQADELYAWMPGVIRPSATQQEAIANALEAHHSGGRQALDREVRKLEQRREPPPKPAP